MAHHELGELSQAVSDFDTALRLEPLSNPSRYARGIARVMQGEYTDAIPDFDAVLALDPANADALSGKGVARSALGQYEEAIGELDRSLTLQPDNPIVLIARGLAHVALEVYDKAFEDFGGLLEIEPDHTGARSARAFVRMDCGQFEEAIQDIERLIELAPDDAHAYYGRGWPAWNWASTPRQLRTWTRPCDWTPSNHSRSPAGRTLPSWPGETAPHSSGGVPPRYSSPPLASGTMISMPPGINQANRATCHTSPPVNSAPSNHSATRS